MNVIVADIAMERDPNAAPVLPSAHETDDANGCLVLGALYPVKAGEELTYVYNAPTTRDDTTGYRTVNVAACVARWGFLPEPPLT